jgi:hypothetical protein
VTFRFADVAVTWSIRFTGNDVVGSEFEISDAMVVPCTRFVLVPVAVSGRVAPRVPDAELTESERPGVGVTVNKQLRFTPLLERVAVRWPRAAIGAN